MADKQEPIEGEIVRSELAVILDEQGVSPESQKALVEAFATKKPATRAKMSDRVLRMSCLRGEVGVLPWIHR